MAIAAILLAVILAVSVFLFNRMVAMRRLSQNAWSDVDVFLRHRYDLIPNLVEAVRGAAQHEQATLERLSNARSKALQATNLGERSSGERELSLQLNGVLSLSEAYPTLQASSNFLQLQRDLSDTERRIADARRYYNACVRDYNTLIESFPNSLIAQLGGFRAEEFFEVESIGERVAPSVSRLNS